MSNHEPDLHVASLRYTLRPSEHVSYANPEPLEFETEHARFRLAEGKLSCEMKTHYSKAQEARAVIDPVLRAWEVATDLQRSRGELRFDFEAPDIIDRSPPPAGGGRMLVMAALEGHSTFSATLSCHVTRVHYPEPPPSTFRLSADAESILLRYEGYLDGREPLPTMAYFCLTVLEAQAGAKARGRRKRAAKMYSIEKAVLDKLGELASERGDRLTARKATAVRPLTGLETTWLEAAVKMLIWRLGDSHSPQSLPPIKMSDLPTLK